MHRRRTECRRRPCRCRRTSPNRKTGLERSRTGWSPDFWVLIYRPASCPCPLLAHERRKRIQFALQVSHLVLLHLQAQHQVFKPQPQTIVALSQQLSELSEAILVLANGFLVSPVAASLLPALLQQIQHPAYFQQVRHLTP